MRRLTPFIALLAFLAPIALRAGMFYRGVYRPPETIATPAFAELEPPSPPVGRPAPKPEPLEAPKRVLFDQTHGNQYQMPEVESLTAALTARGAQIIVDLDTFDSSAPELGERLLYVDAYVVLAPTEAFSVEEIQQVADFVARGGRLLVIADPTRARPQSLFLESSPGGSPGDVTVANALLEPYDLAFSEDYLYNLVRNEGNFRHLILERFSESDLTVGLRQVVFYTTRSVRTDTGLPLILGDENTFSSRTDTGGDLAAAALSADGNVLAVGDMTFLTEPYNQVADNPRWISRMVNFLVGGKVRRGLSAFPYFFGPSVAIVRSDALPLNSDNLASLGHLRLLLEAVGTEVSIESRAPEEGDLLLTGLYDQTDSTVDLYLDLLNVALPSESDDGTLRLPGLGGVQPEGTGTVLLRQTSKRTVLVLLADSTENLRTLLDYLVSRDFSGCLLEEKVAVCRVGLGSG